MGISEGRINLNGARIALQSPINVLHLLERITHITVCISKRWLNTVNEQIVKELIFKQLKKYMVNYTELPLCNASELH